MSFTQTFIRFSNFTFTFINFIYLIFFFDSSKKNFANLNLSPLGLNCLKDKIFNSKLYYLNYL